MEYVNTKATFKCPMLNGSIVAQETCNRSVTADGSFLMTSSGTKLTGNGTCKILSAAGGPKPCLCKLSSTLSGWRILSNNTVAGSKLLLKNSVATCNIGIGAVIRISDAGQRKVVKGNNEFVPSLVPLIIETVAESSVESSAIEFSAAQNSSTKDSLTKDSLTKDSPTKDSPTSNSTTQDIPTQNLMTEDKTFIPRTGLLCSCQAKKPDEKCKDCEYRLDRRINPVVENNSGTLRKNYEKAQHDQYDRYFDSLFADQNSSGVVNGWSTAAHHIISGKQVLEKFPRLVKLARFCGYDVDDDNTKEHGINHYPNCIMLVGYPSDYGKTEDGLTPQSKDQREWAKSADADEVMSKSQVQWHVGSHQYRFAKGEKIILRRNQREQQERQAVGSVFIDNMQTVLGKRKEFSGQDLTISNYADLVKARLQKLEDELKSNPVCYKDDAAKKDFIAKMETISHEIKQKLAAFREKPYRSYPYFVSLEAYLYAFAVPRIVHVVLIKPHEQGLRLTPWRITRYANTLQDASKSLSFESTGEGIYLPKATPDEKLIRKCLREVCIKARCFLLVDVADEMKSEVLPFLLDAERDVNHGTAYFFQLNGNDQSDIELLQEKDSDIAIWLRRTAKKLAERDDLQGDAGVLRTRLKLVQVVRPFE